MRKYLLGAALSCMTMAAQVPGAQAASVSIDIDVQLPEILVLYCYSDVSVTITSGVFSTIFAAGSTADPDGAYVTLATNPDASTSGANLDVDLDATTDPAIGTPTTTATLNLNDICAVRGITSDGTVDVTATGPTQFDPGTAGGTALTGADGTGSIAVGTITASTAGTVSLGALTAINVSMPLDFANVTGAGNFAVNNPLVVTASFP